MKFILIFYSTILSLCFSLSAISSEYSEQELKSLFTTPEQRSALNEKRLNNKFVPDKQTFSRPASVHINGIVSRSDGKSVVWVNGQNTMKNSMVGGVKVYSDAMTSSHKIPVMIDGRKVYIKPGDSWKDNIAVEKEDL